MNFDQVYEKYLNGTATEEEKGIRGGGDRQG